MQAARASMESALLAGHQWDVSDVQPLHVSISWRCWDADTQMLLLHGGLCVVGARGRRAYLLKACNVFVI